jgi:hypothetical protein
MICNIQETQALAREYGVVWFHLNCPAETYQQPWTKPVGYLGLSNFYRTASMTQ